MSYETPDQKALLRDLETSAAKCSAAGIKHGKALAALNQGYGKAEPSDARRSSNKVAAEACRINTLASISARRAKAIALCQLTGAQVRLAKQMPDEYAAQVADDQLVGDVFTLEELESFL